MRKPLPPIVLRTAADLTRLRTTWIKAMETDDVRSYERRVIAFKWSRPDGTSFYNPRQAPILCHALHNHLEVTDANTNPYRQCEAGVNVAAASWVASETRYRHTDAALWQVEFGLCDIAAVPFNHSGKLRVYKATITHKLTRKKLLSVRNGRAPYMKTAK